MLCRPVGDDTELGSKEDLAAFTGLFKPVR